MAFSRGKVIEGILDQLDDTRIQSVLTGRGLDISYLDQDDLTLKQQQDLLEKQLEQMEDQDLRDLHLDVARTAAADQQEQLRISIGRRVQDLWKEAVGRIEDEASYIRQVLIPKAEGFDADGNTKGYEDTMQEIKAASVALVSRVNQFQGDVRQTARSELYSEAPHIDRATRNGMVNDATNVGTIMNGKLVPPPVIDETQREVMDLRERVRRRRQDHDEDLQMQQAAREEPSPKP